MDMTDDGDSDDDGGGGSGSDLFQMMMLRRKNMFWNSVLDVTYETSTCMLWALPANDITHM